METGGQGGAGEAERGQELTSKWTMKDKGRGVGPASQPPAHHRPRNAHHHHPFLMVLYADWWLGHGWV